MRLTLIGIYIFLVKKVCKSISKDKAITIFNEVKSRNKLPKDLRLELVNKRSDESDSIDLVNNVISLDSSSLYEVILLHEMGHSFYSTKKGSNNNKMKAKMAITLNDTVELPKYVIYDAEVEAWEFAKNNYSGNWGMRMERLKNLCLKTYRIYLETN